MKHGNWKRGCPTCRMCSIPIESTRPGSRWKNSNRNSCCWTTASNTGVWLAIWTSCCWTPPNRSAAVACSRAACCASRSRDLARADLVVLTRTDLVSPARRDQIRHQALQQAPRAAWAEVAYRPSRLLSASGQSFPLDAWAGARVAAFCGIGNPQAFRETLTRQGWHVAQFHEFPDHHRFTRSDVESLAREAHASGTCAPSCVPTRTSSNWAPTDWARCPCWRCSLKPRSSAARPRSKTACAACSSKRHRKRRECEARRPRASNVLRITSLRAMVS